MVRLSVSVPVAVRCIHYQFRSNSVGVVIGFLFALISALSVIVLLRSQRSAGDELDYPSQSGAALRCGGLVAGGCIHLVCLLLLLIMMWAYFGGLDPASTDPLQIPPVGGCPSKSQNCVRWTTDATLSYSADGLPAPVLTNCANLSEAVDRASQFFEWLPGSSKLYQNETKFHYRVVTTVFGFADDVWVSISRDVATDRCIMDTQSQSRVGTSDLGVNRARIESFAQFMGLVIA